MGCHKFNLDHPSNANPARPAAWGSAANVVLWDEAPVNWLVLAFGMSSMVSLGGLNIEPMRAPADFGFFFKQL